MFFLCLFSVFLSAVSPKTALLPCERLSGASAKNANRLDSSLRKVLGTQVDLIPRDKVEEAMSSSGVESSRACDDKCLVDLGHALGADRVVTQTLSFQRKEQVKGGVWVWIVHQVDVCS